MRVVPECLLPQPHQPLQTHLLPQRPHLPSTSPIRPSCLHNSHRCRSRTRACSLHQESTDSRSRHGQHQKTLRLPVRRARGLAVSLRFVMLQCCSQIVTLPSTCASSLHVMGCGAMGSVDRLTATMLRPPHPHACTLALTPFVCHAFLCSSWSKSSKTSNPSGRRASSCMDERVTPSPRAASSGWTET